MTGTAHLWDAHVVLAQQNWRVQAAIQSSARRAAVAEAKRRRRAERTTYR